MDSAQGSIGSAIERRRRGGARLRNGDPVVGFMLASALSMDFVQFLTPQPDFVIVEMEHSHFAWPDVAACLRMLNLLGVLSLVRIPEISYSSVSLALDAGADGVLVPRVRTPDEVERAVEAMLLPPHGGKGVGGYDFQVEPLAERIKHHDTDKLLLVQIENSTAVENLPQLLSVGRVAGLIVGPFDLSQSLGIPGDFENPRFAGAIETIVHAARGRGIAVGAMMPSASLGNAWRAIGMSISWVGTEVSLFTSGWTEAHATVVGRAR